MTLSGSIIVGIRFHGLIRKNYALIEKALKVESRVDLDSIIETALRVHREPTTV